MGQPDPGSPCRPTRRVRQYGGLSRVRTRELYHRNIYLCRWRTRQGIVLRIAAEKKSGRPIRREYPLRRGWRPLWELTSLRLTDDSTMVLERMKSRSVSLDRCAIYRFTLYMASLNPGSAISFSISSISTGTNAERFS